MVLGPNIIQFIPKTGLASVSLTNIIESHLRNECACMSICVSIGAPHIILKIAYIRSTPLLYIRPILFLE